VISPIAAGTSFVTGLLGVGAALIGGVWLILSSRRMVRLKAQVAEVAKAAGARAGLDWAYPLKLMNAQVGGAALLAPGGPPEDDPEGDAASEALLHRYHAQGLAQSQISFWFSITFAALGFGIIAFGATSAFLVPNTDAIRSAVPIVSGVIIDAVSGLFFVQSNRARQLMSDFFDKLRADNKLSEALRLADEITDQKVASNLRAYLSMHFAGIDVGVDAFRSVAGLPIRVLPRGPVTQAQHASGADGVGKAPAPRRPRRTDTSDGLLRA
jgi:hypothetical protein